MGASMGASSVSCIPWRTTGGSGGPSLLLSWTSLKNYSCIVFAFLSFSFSFFCLPLMILLEFFLEGSENKCILEFYSLK